MAKRQIIIYLDRSVSQSDAEVSWLVLQDGQRPGPVFRGDLKTAANHASGCIVTVIVPGEDILLTDVSLPAMNRQRLLKAIPFAMEEYVAADVGELHFATGQRYESGELGLAIVSKNTTEMWLSLLKQAGIHPDQLVSDVHAVPYAENTWSIYAAANNSYDRVIIRNDEQVGLVVDSDNLLSVLTIALENCDEALKPTSLSFTIQKEHDTESIDFDETIDAPADENQPQENDLIEQSEIIKKIKELCERLEVEFHSQISEESTIEYFAKHYSQDTHINLLQGDFSRKEQLEKMFRPWRPAAAVAAVWMLLQVGLLVVEYQHLSAKEKELREQVVAIYKEAFPKAKNIVDPKKQMQSKLKKLRSNQGSDGGFISLLHKTGAVLSDTQAMTVKGMRFKANKLDIDIEISDLQALDELKSRLVNKAELQVEIVSASAKEGKVDSRIQVQAQSS